MIFKSISFYQYRCFMKGTVDFCTANKTDRSITLIQAPNGSGKTELLFAFWWVLYGFDFTTLINKEDTPYAINSKIYRDTLNGNFGDKEFCQVKLYFESEGVEYTIQKKRYYEKTTSKKSLKEWDEVELSTIDKHGVSTVPLRNQKEIEKKIQKLIPEKVLNGIIFDGERMQRISSANEKSPETIKGVINDVTNKEFIDLCLTTFNDISSKYNAELRNLAKAGGNIRLNEITTELGDLDVEILKMKDSKDILESKRGKLESELILVQDKLKESQKTRGLMIKLEERNSEKKSLTKLIDDKVEDLYGELNRNGYTFVLDKLFEDVDSLIKSYNIPEGLTVRTVENILKQEFCICGSRHSQSTIETLTALKKLLPPDNLNSVIKEEMNGLKNKKNDTSHNLRKVWKDFKDAEKRLKDCKDEINTLSNNMGTISDESGRLEKRRSEIERELGSISSTLKALPIRIERAEAKYKALSSEKTTITKNMGLEDSIMPKHNFVEKCKKALTIIKEKSSKSALTEINHFLDKAYEELAEDWEDGRGVYITQYTNKPYKIVNYYYQHVNQYIQDADWTSLAVDYGIKYGELTEEIKREIAILENAVSKSTGQSKSVTIAFVKAILDYSCIDKEDDFQSRKVYPLVIDAPFSDLSGENLIRPAKKLSSFSEQVILMLAPSNYLMVQEYIRPKVGRLYKIEKVKEKNQSLIKGVM